MSLRPQYFEETKRRAAKRWEQLEQDPELAGPWHQLFKQVQSPRHVVSELLQNADDAGAVEAGIRVEQGAFLFEHNGGDFTPEHFASLCRFGYSNKRALHTIGFRGIGFKSTFSLGDRVELYSPSLAVRFDRSRFTEPHWASGNPRTDGKTCVRVSISDRHRESEVQKNLKEWLKSPVSLLFFKNIRRVQIDSHVMHWTSLGAGPVADSEWMVLDGSDQRYLLLRSSEEAFPEDALAEIKQERMLSAEEEMDFPPCRVELVLGAPGRLYVVLPTLVEAALPFACNAPFIQDPARLKIKDPETSPTNRWLLERAGRLAATAMLGWLGQQQMQVAHRAGAYALLSDVDREDSSLEGTCAAIVEEAAAEVIEEGNVLLTDDGTVVAADQSIVIPDPILDVWPVTQAAALMDEKGRPPLSRDVAESDREKLLHWGLIEEIEKSSFLALLKTRHFPRPKSWRQLLTLWDYVAPEINGYWHRGDADKVRIVPVQGKDVLFAAAEVVRLGEKKLLQSDDDWSFLSKHLVVLNQNWTRYLAEQRRAAEDLGEDNPLRTAVEAAYAVLEETGLDKTSDADKVVDQVAAEFFGQDEIGISECVQLAQIAARLGAQTGTSFRFATRDGTLKTPADSVLIDVDGRLEGLLPHGERDTALLHPDYLGKFKSCTREEWDRWIGQGKSGLLGFVPLEQKRQTVWGRDQIKQEAQKRGFRGELYFPYVTGHFIIDDWDFPQAHWRHWQGRAKDDPDIWGSVAERLLLEREAYWGKAKSARLLQVATTHNTRSLTHEPIAPGWALRLRGLPCLPDTRGVYRKPSDLLRRTAETEALIDVEPFIDKLLDRETTQPLLDLLGVRKTPTGPDRILEFLRALAKSEKPPIHEVEKWYRRLDQMFSASSTDDSRRIRHAFQSEKLILAEDGSWTTAAGIFLSSDEEDVPGAAVVRASVGDLALWRRVGIEDRPTAELALAWLEALPSSGRLSADELKRVRAFIVRYPHRAWEECGHWLNLAGDWVPTDGLAYALTMQTLVPWAHLHQWVKQKTADLQRLPAEVVGGVPFSTLLSLGGQIDERLDRKTLLDSAVQTKQWLAAAGSELSRMVLDSDDETNRVRGLARTLQKTRWQSSPGLEIVPYIDGTPAGTARRADAIWLGDVLHVDELPKARLAKRVPEEIGRVFARADIKAALDYSFERSAEDVRAYFEENFTLAPAEAANGAAAKTKPDEREQVAKADTGEEDGAPHGDVEDSQHHDATGAVGAPNSAESDDDADQPQESGSGESVVVRPRPSPKPTRPSLIERFAKAHGFAKDGDARFFHADGSSIAKTMESRFPWERRSAAGDLLRYYWPKEHCLEQEPLQLEADVWSAIDQQPEHYALILTNNEGTPVELTGDRLRAMRLAGEVTLYPATYRIVYSNDRSE